MAEPEEIAVLRQLVAAFPVPDGSWHGFADEIAACRDDLAAAVEAIDGDEPALAASVRGRHPPGPGGDARRARGGRREPGCDLGIRATTSYVRAGAYPSCFVHHSSSRSPNDVWKR